MIKSNFFGRQNYLELLKKRIGDLRYGYRQNLAVIGQESIGKTTLLFKFMESFFDSRIILIYLEIRPESVSCFAKRFIGVLLYNFLVNSGLELREDLDFLVEKSQKFIPKTVEKIKLVLTIINRRKKKDVFAQLLSLCEAVYSETGKHCVLIFDEFQNLESMGMKNLYSDWSKQLILSKNNMFILVSSFKNKSKAILSKHLSSLFGNFQEVLVEPFDIKTAKGYIDFKLQGRQLDEGLKDFLVDFTGGSPMCLEIITDAILNSKETSLSQLLEGLLFDSLGIFNERFSNCIKRLQDFKNSNDYISILYLIASGRNRLKDISQILRKPKNEIMPRVNFLLELDTITRSADFLKINDRVFGFWLRFVYQERLNSLTFDARNQKTKFRDRIEEIIQEFMAAASRPLLDRMNELLRLFEDETIQLERKKVRLNHFREVKPLEFGGRSLKDGILGRSNDYLWIVAVKQGFLTEEDIIDFMKECKKYKQKPQRRVLVTLNDIDTNARLRAMEEKIWTLDVNNLNQIFDLYCKPRVIV